MIAHNISVLFYNYIFSRHFVMSATRLRWHHTGGNIFVTNSFILYLLKRFFLFQYNNLHIFSHTETYLSPLFKNTIIMVLQKHFVWQKPVWQSYSHFIIIFKIFVYCCPVYSIFHIT